MKVANYYPQYSRLDLFDEDNVLIKGITGVDAHVKAVNLAAEGQTTIFIKYESKLNKKANRIKEIA